jgi:hypothetical protein
MARVGKCLAVNIVRSNVAGFGVRGLQPLGGLCLHMAHASPLGGFYIRIERAPLAGNYANVVKRQP